LKRVEPPCFRSYKIIYIVANSFQIVNATASSFTVQVTGQTPHDLTNPTLGSIRSGDQLGGHPSGRCLVPLPRIGYPSMTRIARPCEPCHTDLGGEKANNENPSRAGLQYGAV
jgi:hypothetical protein